MLDTACRVFSRSSYRGATTAEIAREAGISEPILYRHFGSKRDLYLACLDEAWRELPRGSASRRSPRIPSGCLGAIADAYMAKRRPHPHRRPLDPGADGGVGRRGDRGGAAQAGPRGARLLRRRDSRRPARAASSTPTATRSPRRGSSSPAACSTTMDNRLGGLLGDDLQRVRTERRRWMLGPRRPQKPSPDTRKPRLRHPGLFPGQAGRRLGDFRVRPCGTAGCSDLSPLALPLHSTWRQAVGARCAHSRSHVPVCQVARSSDFGFAASPDFARNNAPFGGHVPNGGLQFGQVSCMLRL